MKRLLLPASLFLLSSLLLASCLPAPVNAAQSTPNVSTVEAAVVQTIEADSAQQTATAPTSTPTSTETPTETPTETARQLPQPPLPTYAYRDSSAVGCPTGGPLLQRGFHRGRDRS